MIDFATIHHLVSVCDCILQIVKVPIRTKLANTHTEKHFPVSSFCQGNVFFSCVCRLTHRFRFFHKVRRMADVFFHRTPFQIIGRIVRPVVVYVVYLRQSVRVRNERFSHKPMNIAGSSAFANSQADCKIPVSVIPRPQDCFFYQAFATIPVVGYKPRNASHISSIANLIPSFISGDIFPNFHLLTPSAFQFSKLRRGHGFDVHGLALLHNKVNQAAHLPGVIIA